MKSYGVSKGFGKCCTILTLNFHFGWILDKFIPYEIDHQPPPLKNVSNSLILVCSVLVVFVFGTDNVILV